MIWQFSSWEEQFQTSSFSTLEHATMLTTWPKLLDKITWLLDVERQEVKLMAEFISVFYVV